MTRKLMGVLAFVGAMATVTGQTQAEDVMITGYMDGTLSGGEPKILEVYARNAVPDLSKYAISRAGNGAATFTTIDADFILPAVSLAAGQFFYAVGNSFGDQTPNFDLVFPAKATPSSRARNFGINSNGDDVTGLFFDATGAFGGGETLIDVVGELGVDGTGTAWEHTDSYIYSKNGRTPSATFDVNDWNVPGINLLDPCNPDNHACLADGFPDMTFVPEPASLVLLGLGGLMLVRRRAA